MSKRCEDGGAGDADGDGADEKDGCGVRAAAHDVVVEQDAGVEEDKYEAGEYVVHCGVVGDGDGDEGGEASAGGDNEHDAQVRVEVGAVDDEAREGGDGAGEQQGHGDGLAVGESLGDGEIGVAYSGPADEIGADAEKEGEEDAGGDGERFGRGVGRDCHCQCSVRGDTLYISIKKWRCFTLRNMALNFI